MHRGLHQGNETREQQGRGKVWNSLSTGQTGETGKRNGRGTEKRRTITDRKTSPPAMAKKISLRVFSTCLQFQDRERGGGVCLDNV